MSRSHPLPVVAETGIASAKPHWSTAVVIRDEELRFRWTRSILLRTASAGTPIAAIIRGPRRRRGRSRFRVDDEEDDVGRRQRLRAAPTIARFIRSRGRWKPGVSTKTICPAREASARPRIR
jgi:hypothetical protein